MLGLKGVRVTSPVMVSLGLLWNLGQPRQLGSTWRTNGPTNPPHAAIARCQALDDVNCLRGIDVLTHFCHFIISCLTWGSPPEFGIKPHPATDFNPRWWRVG